MLFRSLIQTDGSVRNEELKEAEIVMLTARFQYGEQEFEQVFPVRVQPVILTKREALIRNMENSLKEQDEASRTSSSLKLPDRIDSENVIWKEVIQDNSGILFLLVCAAALLVFYAGEREVERSLAERNRELLRDYPEIVHKLTL